MDAATYQQLVHQNIEPELSIDYVPLEIEGALIGVLTISGCDNPPYMMRKDFSPLRRGECWVRKGTQRVRFARPDFDRIVARRHASGSFTGKLKIVFEGSSSTTIQLPSIGSAPPPSLRAAEKIENILAVRKMPGSIGAAYNLLGGTAMYGVFGQPVPYEARKTEELQKNLANVRRDYADQDEYELGELRAAKVNLVILNESESYLEDATVELEFPILDGFTVRKALARKPVRPQHFSIPDFSLPQQINYPRVEVRGSKIVVAESVGDLKHGMATEIFDVPVRVVIGRTLEGQTLAVRCRVFGKNLRAPIVQEMTIVIVPPSAKEEDTEEA